jgi:GWxTD domain-containing protein
VPITSLSIRLLLTLLLASSCLSAAAAQKPDTTVRIFSKPYQKWLDEDVRWIITDQERADFMKLTTDKQRDQFVEAFWESRNPAPGAPENKFKEARYQRIAYANQHFASGVPGFKTDRGHFYILYGPPDSVQRDPKLSPMSEVWHYRNVYGFGQDVVLRFVDTCQCGDYRLVENHPEKPAAAPH